MSHNATAHGLEGDWERPDWPPITLDFARRLITHFPQAGCPEALVSISPRPFSSASVIQTDRNRVFIKRHSWRVRDVEGLEEEHRFMAHLRAKGAPVPVVFAVHSGATAVVLEDSFGLWSCEVQSVPDGVDLYRDALSWTPFQSPEHAYSAGQALAEIHCCAGDYDAPQRAPRPLVASFTIFAAADSDAALDSFLVSRPHLAHYIEQSHSAQQAFELLAPFHRELQPLMSKLDPLWTHNDLHASNLLWSSNQLAAHTTAVLDFGLADRTNCVHDLALAIERNIVEWLKLPPVVDQGTIIPVHFGALQALIDGYQSVRPLSSSECAALAPMTALCHAEFALSEADYFLTALHSQHKASLAVDGYLLGHARWFRSLNGEQLIDAIRRAVTPIDSLASQLSSRGEPC